MLKHYKIIIFKFNSNDYACLAESIPYVYDHSLGNVVIVVTQRDIQWESYVLRIQHFSTQVIIGNGNISFKLIN